MNLSFSSFDRYSIASAELMEAEVRGHGTHVCPILHVPLRLTVDHGYMKPGEGIGVQRIGGKLSLPNQQPLAHSRIFVINHRLHAAYSRLADCGVTLEFPLDALKLAHIEKQRNGSDARFRIELELVTDSLCALNQPAPPTEMVWGLKQRWLLQANADFGVPRDRWIENVLPHVGFGVIHVLELPAVPSEVSSALGSAFRALRDAQELHKQGHYDEAVGKCRIALESVLERTKKMMEDGKVREVPTLPPSWETKLGSRTYEWLVGMFPPLKDAANKVMHPPYVERYGQLESQLILAVSAALMAYAARVAESEPPGQSTKLE